MKEWKQRPWDEALNTGNLEAGISPLLSFLLAQRGIGPDKAEEFARPTLDLLSSPTELGPGMDIARDFIIETAGKKVAVLGDYDVDGILSTAILAKLCQSVGSDVMTFIPSRIKEGYGLNKKTIKAFTEKWGDERPEMLIVTDSGSSSEANVVALKEWGAKRIVIVDHHLVDPEHESVSADAYINWRKCGPHEMCSAGQAFHIARHVCEKTGGNPLSFISFAAVATIADCMGIKGDNRTMVKLGLPEVWQSNSMGFSILTSKVGNSAGLFQKDVMFAVAPRINAVGRIRDPDLVLELFMTEDPARAREIADLMEEANTERKKIQKTMQGEAIGMMKESYIKNGALLYNKDWAPGICGIACSKLVEKFGVPVLMFGEHQGNIKGSGRSLEGVNVHEIMKGISDIFSAFGGHEMACGATLKRDMLNSASTIFDNACKEYYKKHGRPTREWLYDAELRPSTITTKTCESLLEAIHPYCDINNPEPVFKVSGVRLNDVAVKEGPTWRLISFGASKDGEHIDMKFKTFMDDLEVPQDGVLADIYFSFPQTYDERKQRELDIVDLVIR
jgi:single-stranded-DNA-specific exonuclease